MKLWLSVVAMLLLFYSACFASSRSQREHGAEIFAQSGCSHCHVIGKTGGTRGPDLSGVGRRLKEAQMRRQIVEGSKTMPPFGPVIQDPELADLVSYLRSCRDKKKK